MGFLGEDGPRTDIELNQITTTLCLSDFAWSKRDFYPASLNFFGLPWLNVIKVFVFPL
jgi:hypothetical protein